MSAGICIMNKNAIALAADSAVTIGPHLAIHNSANKLFALSKVAPVGAIIYSNAEVMGIPVEILIKQYKRDLGQKAYEAVILSGVTIGDGAIIGTRAVVTKDVPPYTIVGGVPVKTIRKRFSDDTIAALLQINWWDWPEEKIKQHMSEIQAGRIDRLQPLCKGEPHDGL